MLQLNGISKQYGSKILFEGADAFIGTRSRMALIGPNGSGKSTLIRMILGQEAPDSGRITRSTHLSIGHLAQEVPKTSARSVLAETLRLDGRREDLLDARQELEEKLAGEHTEADLERYGRILEELEAMDEYRIEARAKEILQGMGFSEKDFDRPLSEFSGGWLMRVALSRVLLMEPDLLLLDEPTNHLDLESLLWLEEFLRGYRGAFLLVSHDSAFLNRLVNEVLEVDQNRIFSYRGNIDSYLKQKEERIELLRSQYASQQAKIAELERFIERFRAKATKARQAQSRVKQLEKMDRIELEEGRESIRFRFPPAPKGGREVVTLKDAAFGYANKQLFRDLDFTIQRGSRLAIVGVNGAGKTTLLKLLAGAIAPTSGEIKLGHEVKVGYYAQHQAEALDLKKTVLQEIESAAPDLPISRIRGIAGAFLFSGDAVEKRCAVLSGGEKARVALAKMLLTPSNFMLLDEPTNHLDVESRGVLLEALQDYEGTLCLVSHDRDFISPLVTSVLEIVPGAGGSQVIPLVGGYEDYLARKMAEASQAVKRSLSGEPRESVTRESRAPTAAAKTGPSNNQVRAWEKERDTLERDIERLESEASGVEGLLADPATYSDKPKSLTLMEKQRVLRGDVSAKMARWEEVCGLLEAAAQSRKLSN